MVYCYECVMNVCVCLLCCYKLFLAHKWFMMIIDFFPNFSLKGGGENMFGFNATICWSCLSRWLLCWLLKCKLLQIEEKEREIGKEIGVIGVTIIIKRLWDCYLYYSMVFCFYLGMTQENCRTFFLLLELTRWT